MIFCKSGKKNSFHRVANFHSVACWTKIFRKILTKMFCKKLTIICILWKLQNIPHDSRREIMEVFFYLASPQCMIIFWIREPETPKVSVFYQHTGLFEGERSGGRHEMKTNVCVRKRSKSIGSGFIEMVTMGEGSF